MKNINHSKLFLYSIAIFFVGLLLSFQKPASAYVSTEYKTDQSYVPGTVVSLGNKGQILQASADAGSYLGVVTSQTKGALYVTDAGVVSVIVSDADGAINIGDRVGVSDIAGTATLWKNGRSLVGVAQTAPKDWKEVSALSPAGKTETVRVASIGVQLISESSTTAQVNPLVNAIQSAAQGVAGRSVDMWRIVTALLVGLGGLVLSFGLLFISSRESFFSLGRNPMASRVIMGSLWKTVLVAVLAMCLSLAAAYFIVRIG